MDRRLAAILHADVVGYSRLMEGAETRTFRELKMLLDDVWLPALRRHAGRLVNTAGDAMLVEFGSAVAAVRCAMELQVTMSERNSGRPPGYQVTLRIGLNVGEVIVDGGNIYGDAVNLAARLQGLAEPGTVIASSRLREAVEGKVSFGFSDLGDRQVKNITRPVRVHRVLPTDAGAGAALMPMLDEEPAALRPAVASAVPSSSPYPSVSAANGLDPTVIPSGARPPSGASYPAAGAGPGPSLAPFDAPPSGNPPAAGRPSALPAALDMPPLPPSSPLVPTVPRAPSPALVGKAQAVEVVPAAPGWRLVGADRTGMAVDMHLEGGLLEGHEGVVFGRLPRYCHLTFDNDSISRRHARFKVSAAGALTIEDLGSTNGTAVDGRRLEPYRPVPLRDGSRISLGEIKAVITKG